MAQLFFSALRIWNLVCFCIPLLKLLNINNERIRLSPKKFKTMKRIFTTLLLCSLALFTTSCNGEEDKNQNWDVYPLVFQFEIVDASGKNLLDEKTSGNILDEDIKIIYDRTEFHVGVDMNDKYTPTKTYEPDMYGLKIKDKKLLFGEFDGTEDREGFFMISWEDGTYDEIEFIYDFSWGNNSPYSNTTILLNGKKVKDKNLVKIVRK